MRWNSYDLGFESRIWPFEIRVIKGLQARLLGLFVICFSGVPDNAKFVYHDYLHDPEINIG